MAHIQRITLRSVATPMVEEDSSRQAGGGATAAGAAPVMEAPQRPSEGGHQRVVSTVADRVAGLHGTDGSGNTRGDAIQV